MMKSKTLDLIHQKGVWGLVRENYLLVPLLILFVISSFGFYTRPTEFPPIKVVGVIAIAAYFVAAFYRYVLQHGGDFQYVEFIGALILAINFIVQFTGGLHSPWIVLHTLLMMAVGINYSLRISLLTVVRIGFLEGFNALAVSLRTDRPFEWEHYLWLLLGLVLVAIVGEASMVLLKRRLNAAEGALESAAVRAEEEARERKRFLPILAQSIVGETAVKERSSEILRGTSEGRHRKTSSRRHGLLRRAAAADHPGGVRDDQDFEKTFLNFLKATLHASHVCFFVRDGEGKFSMHWAADHGRELDEKGVFVEGEGVLGYSAKNNVALIGKRPPGSSVHAAHRDFVYLSGGGESVRAYMTQPILQGERVEGLLVADRVEESRTGGASDYEFKDSDQQMMKSAVALLEMEWQKARTAQEDRHSKEILTSFLRLMARISATTDIQAVGTLLLEEWRTVMEYETGALALIVEDGSGYSLVSKVGFELEGEASISNEVKTWTRWAISSADDAFMFSDFRQRKGQMPIYAPSEPPLSVGSFLAIPLGQATRRLGALVLTHGQPGQFTTESEQMLKLLCQHASVIIENAATRRQMEVFAVTDGLTQLPNHRCFQDRLEEEISRARRTQKPLSLLILDIDHFKKFNDSHGHPFGDAVLRHFAGIIERCLRHEDFAGRIGGEEFAILLADSPREGARETAERLRSEVERTLFAHAGNSARITLSGGIATFPRDGGSKDQLVQNAERALFYAKRAGHNRIVQFHVIDAMQLPLEFKSSGSEAGG